MTWRGWRRTHGEPTRARRWKRRIQPRGAYGHRASPRPYCVQALAAHQATRDVLAAEFLDLSDEIASFDRNLERVKVLHHRLSSLMGREEELVRSLAPA